MSNRSTSAGSSWPHPIQAVALDMDGLMFDTEPLYYQVGTELLGRRGFEFNMQIQQEMMGRPAPEAIGVLIAEFQLTDLPADLMQESDDLYAALLADGLVALPGLFELLDHLETQSIPFAVATSSKRRFAQQMLSSFDLIPRLQFLLTGDDVSQGKPHPEMYLAAADRFQIQPENMLVLEDSENGCISAARSGACAVAVPGEHTAGHRYDQAFLSIDSLADRRLFELLQS
ncbi:HAD family hydrolase [Rosistilla oblonga]|uniref:HAD family hydrolase n=1 Tax=Rosistilla oblonga TaxID=2527990 RepID=UPI003A96AEEA